MTVINPYELEGDVTLSDVATALGGLGVGGLGVALVTGVFGRKKSKADAVAVLTEAAAAMVEPLRKELAVVRKELEDHKEADRTRQSKQIVAAARHTAWDNQVRESLRANGIEVAAPPPLEVT
ncbi:hypothetical protein [Nocardia sp. CC227C]|uniref:hypothetical protein n=1 Tax=Nocardia sp. CC227C TaxID=3044562 RepID=UPI00278C04BA|nr:hypothetical protein [Nocardia sp. CC227C]